MRDPLTIQLNGMIQEAKAAVRPHKRSYSIEQLRDLADKWHEEKGIVVPRCEAHLEGIKCCLDPYEEGDQSIGFLDWLEEGHE
jgi:hypothetical protein